MLQQEIPDFKGMYPQHFVADTKEEEYRKLWEDRYGKSLTITITFHEYEELKRKAELLDKILKLTKNEIKS